MAGVYTDPKRYKAATPVSYLTGEDAALYKGLGEVKFMPTTRKMNALANFQLGLQLLHVFWYDLAAEKFRQAQTMDPRLAMAYWGEAMCYKQPLWQSEDPDKARAVLDRMDKALGPMGLAAVSERERGYVSAAKVLFAANTSLQARETAYSERMQILQDEYQDDPDACAFAALSLLGQLVSTGSYLNAAQAAKVRNDAVELLGECTYYFPKHVGLLHYQSHLYDVPDLMEAANGIAPALALAKNAPASSAAQHMRSHIFLRFGNWSQVVEANKAAVAASDSYCTAVKGSNACDADNRWHALEWQLYGQTQQCAASAAYVSYRRMQSVSTSMNMTGAYGQWLYRTYAQLQLQSLGALGAVPLRNATDNGTAMLPPPLYTGAAIQNAADIDDHFWPPHAEAHALLARVHSLLFGRTAAQQAAPGVNATVGAALARLDAIVAAQAALVNNSAAVAAAAGSALNAEMAALLTTVQLQARALVLASACAANDTARCGEWRPLMDQALALHNNFSASVTLPSLKIAPTPEFYGNLLILTGADPAAAAGMFRTCLQQLPGRMPCLLGAARAARAQGDADGARAAYAKLTAQCGTGTAAGPGDARFPAVLEARGALASPPPPPAKKGARRALLAAAA
ncbi:hypothetical protein GPECTOR_122g449 [Gonium pectorale]|uniref:Uncharacterized protein n=1 Tax=Gonium pectorale TaxID=33097 RepID=A0A150FYP6_GONPE|nr:hypothetical protein GPECTOR_122g449 [Gonium pectorale]|eukprot:KXZ42708.1 hypothetical protein GPECTOR_122g449 [Gonium pectorale]